MRKSKHKSRSRTDGSAFDIAESAEIIDEGVPETNKGVWTFNKRKMIVEFVDPEEIGSENEDMDDAFAPAASWVCNYGNACCADWWSSWLPPSQQRINKLF